MPKIYENIAVTLDSADENLTKLLAEYDRSLTAKNVTAKAADLTHQICMQLRSVLDRTAYRCWNLKVAPSLSEKDQKDAKSRIYFPGATGQASFDSTLGTWRLKQADHPDLHSYLLAQQPFTSDNNKWLAVLFDLAVQGKHIDLTPQKRVEERRVTVSAAGGGSVSWGPGVTFGGGVSVMGAPVDPRTQRIVPTPGVTEKIENWVSFFDRRTRSERGCLLQKCLPRNSSDRSGDDRQVRIVINSRVRPSPDSRPPRQTRRAPTFRPIAPQQAGSNGALRPSPFPQRVGAAPRRNQPHAIARLLLSG